MPDEGRAWSLAATIPGSSGPLWHWQLQAQRRIQGDGHQLRLRLRWSLHLRSSGPAKTNANSGLPARLGRWIESRLQRPGVQRALMPLINRSLSGWVDLRATDASLDDDARTLLPERLAELGIALPKDRPVQTWAGALQGARPGFALLTLLQGKRAAQRQRKPLHLAAVAATVIEED